MSIALCIFAILIQQSYADYTLQVRAVSYRNQNNYDYEDECCDEVCVFSCGTCLITCDVYFFFCIRAMGTSALDTSTCWYSEQSQGEITTDELTFPTNGDLYSGAGVSNPITFDSTDSWPGSFQLLVRIDDADDHNTHDLIDLVTFDHTMSPNDMWSSTIVGHSNYNIATFRVQFKVSCATGFYGSDCNSIVTTSTSTTTTTSTGTSSTTTTTTTNGTSRTSTTRTTAGTTSTSRSSTSPTTAPRTDTNYVPIVAGVAAGAVILVCLSIVISFGCFCYFKKNTDKDRAMESITMQAAMQENSMNRHQSRGNRSGIHTNGRAQDSSTYEECPAYDNLEKS